MAYTVHYLKRGSWIRAMEFVEPKRITKRTFLVDGNKVAKPIRRETFEEAEKAAAPYFEKGYGVKITEVK